VRHRLHPRYVDLLQFLDIVQDVAELLRKFPLLGVGQRQPRKVGHILDVEVGSRIHGRSDVPNREAAEPALGNRQKPREQT
jgi:hypothetical protein